MDDSKPVGPTVFFGTPEWAVPSLRALAGATDIDVDLVVTNPDRPSGRGYEMRSPPVKQAGEDLGIEVAQPESVKDEGFVSRIAAHRPQVAVVVAYGKILPADLLAVPELGFVNLHFSLLPAYRGAAPVQRALIDGRETTGVTIMVLTEGMDEGPILAELECDVDPDESAGELGSRLAVAGADLLVDTLRAYAAGEIEPTEQDHGLATYAPKISNEEARIGWEEPAARIKNKVRGLNPVPGAWTTLRDTRLKLYRVATVEGEAEPGSLRLESDALLVGTGEGLIRVDEAQLHGRRKMPGADLARGMRLGSGERLL